MVSTPPPHSPYSSICLSLCSGKEKKPSNFKNLDPVLYTVLKSPAGAELCS
jgi:hypothetical protein